MKSYFKNLVCTIGGILIASICLAQTELTYPINDASLVSRMREHVKFLADDKLEGRLVGSKGEQKSFKYIQKVFKTYGLKPVGGKSYIQSFTFNRITYNQKTTYLTYTKYFKPGSTHMWHRIAYQQFYPLAFSGIGKVTAPVTYLGYGIVSGDDYNDYKNVGSVKNRIVIINLGYPEKSSSDKYKRFEDISAKADTAIARGAIGVIFLNDDTSNTFPRHKPYFASSSISSRKQVPVVFFPQSDGIKNLSLYDVTISVDTLTETITGHNVIGFLNNNAKHTIVIGAHYDHLGYNEMGGSTFYNNKVEYPRIHNGADDNASGTATMLELANSLSKSSFTNHNYLFVAFSGEEEGLLGSNYLTKHLPVDSSTLNYMINLDMVGRLDSLKGYSISGTGTSPVWTGIIDSIPTGSLHIKYDPSGTGASDHTSFYNIGIPALHYFTGTHYDYHKPSDDEWRINYLGMVSINKHIYDLIGRTDTEPRLVFTPTKDSHSGNASFKVTLGIMPDYLFDGKGIKIDGVTPGKPASVGGIQRGDIIIQLGEFSITDMQSYMNALSKFEKGISAKATIVRNGTTLEVVVTF